MNKKKEYPLTELNKFDRKVLEKYTKNWLNHTSNSDNYIEEKSEKK